MSNRVELHDCSTACPLAHAAPEGAAGAGIGRRAFLTEGALATIALALAACTGDGPVAPPADAANTIRLADHPSLAGVGGVAFVTVGDAPLAVVRTGDASFVALSRVCPHRGGIVEASGGGFTCPLHKAQFSTTGQWVGGRQTSNLISYPVRYQARQKTLTIEI